MLYLEYFTSLSLKIFSSEDSKFGNDLDYIEFYILGSELGQA